MLRKGLRALPRPMRRATANPLFRAMRFCAGGFIVGSTVGTATVVYCWAGNSKNQRPPFDIRGVRRDIECLLTENKSLAPTLVRLAWQGAASWDCKKKDGAPNSAAMRFHPESDYGGNKGLEVARDALKPIKKKHPEISYADLWVLAAYVAVEGMGGPEIPFSWGRVDAKDGSVCGPDGRLPDGAQTQNHVREVFTRLGFNDRETVALIGAHTCGECHVESSGFSGPWTHDKNTFDNSFFTELLAEEWEINPDNEKLQLRDAETKHLTMLPTDISLLLDSDYREYVVLFAKDNELFLKEFSAAFQKLTELGNEKLIEVPTK